MIARILIILLDNRGICSSEQLQYETEYKSSTIDNLMGDLVMFGIAKRQDGIITLTMNNEHQIIKTLQSFFKDHVMYIELSKYEKNGFDYNSLMHIFDKTYETSLYQPKTR